VAVQVLERNAAKTKESKRAFVEERLLRAESLQMETPQFGGRSRFFTGRRILKKNRCPLFLIAF